MRRTHKLADAKNVAGVMREAFPKVYFEDITEAAKQHWGMPDSVFPKKVPHIALWVNRDHNAPNGVGNVALDFRAETEVAAKRMADRAARVLYKAGFFVLLWPRSKKNSYGLSVRNMKWDAPPSEHAPGALPSFLVPIVKRTRPKGCRYWNPRGRADGHHGIGCYCDMLHKQTQQEVVRVLRNAARRARAQPRQRRASSVKEMVRAEAKRRAAAQAAKVIAQATDAYAARSVR